MKSSLETAKFNPIIKDIGDIYIDVFNSNDKGLFLMHAPTGIG
jgi:hypothetical protein